MHVYEKISLRALVLPLAMATLVATPCAFAKKDLFATEPSAKNAVSAQQLAPTTSTASEEHKTAANSSDATKPRAAVTSSVQALDSEPPKDIVATQNEAPKAPAIKEPSAIEVQLARLKRNLTKTKNDLFGSKESPDKKMASAPAIEPQLTDSTVAEDEAKTEVASISTTEAAQRAQTFAEGQVINVRKYSEDNKPRYAVKLLQKNGRMKTINMDAVNGALIEEKPTEENPQ